MDKKFWEENGYESIHVGKKLYYYTKVAKTYEIHRANCLSPIRDNSPEYDLANSYIMVKLFKLSNNI